MNAPAIELPGGRMFLWPDRVRGLFNGLGYVVALGVVLAALWSLESVMPQLVAGQFAVAGRLFLSNTWGGLLTEVPAPVLVPVMVSLAPRAGARRALCLLATAIPLAGWCLYIDGYRFAWDVRSITQPFEYTLTTSLVVGVCAYHSYSRDAAAALLRTQIDRTRLDAALQRAHLKLLRTQIEPHFLFNTLSAVRALARVDRAATVEMLDNLIRYFEAALPRLDAEEVPLVQEMQLVDAYLGIYRVRMGARLGYEISLPKNLENVRVPTMVLLTLVENALKHGVNVALEGGFVRVSAVREKGLLLLKVADSGQGLSSRHGHGTGLANISQRLLLMYGEAAVLSLREAEPRGTVASISIPITG